VTILTLTMVCLCHPEPTNHAGQYGMLLALLIGQRLPVFRALVFRDYLPVTIRDVAAGRWRDFIAAPMIHV